MAEFWWVFDKTQAKASSLADLYRIGFFSFLFCCDLMVDLVVGCGSAFGIGKFFFFFCF